MNQIRGRLEYPVSVPAQLAREWYTGVFADMTPGDRETLLVLTSMRGEEELSAGTLVVMTDRAGYVEGGGVFTPEDYPEFAEALRRALDGMWPEEEIDRALEDHDARRVFERMPSPQGSGARPPSPFEAAHMERMSSGANDNPEYQWYVVIRTRADTNKIESGWEYREDANDQKREFKGSGISVGVYSRRYLRQIGLDPVDPGSWATSADMPPLALFHRVEAAKRKGADSFSDWDAQRERYLARRGGLERMAATDEHTGRWQDSTKVQTLLLDKDNFTRAQAVAWAKSHDFKASKVDSTASYWRIRQVDPAAFHKETFRTIDFRPGVKAVVAVPR